MVPSLSQTPKTLAIDIGGSGIKAIVLDERGEPLTKQKRLKTPRPAIPAAVVKIIIKLASKQGQFDRASIGFPGVVRKGVIYTASNLDPSWNGINLAHLLSKEFGVPVRVANDADIHGYGTIKGHGVELVITLGTGFGSALFVNGHLVPNLELAHHPFRQNDTYEDWLGDQALKKIGQTKWNDRLAQTIDILEFIFNYDYLYIGGGNSKRITLKLGPKARIVANIAGLLGGITCWQFEDEI
jgi:polyphosphate glucokinase